VVAKFETGPDRSWDARHHILPSVKTVWPALEPCPL